MSWTGLNILGNVRGFVRMMFRARYIRSRSIASVSSGGIALARSHWVQACLHPYLVNKWSEVVFCQKLPGKGGFRISKLRGVRSLKKKDFTAMNVLYQGLKMWNFDARFITLTGVTDFKKHWRKMKDYLKKEEVVQEYFGVRTGEGAGVLHLVVVGRRGIQWKVLKKKWEEITGNWVVSIRRVGDIPGLLREMTRQHRTVRYFHSEHWVKPYRDLQQTFDGQLKKEIYREKTMKFVKTV